MCMFNGQTEKVANTNIFVAPNKNKTEQITVYSNSVKSRNENQMILPVPYPDTVRFLVIYKDFFKDLDNSFPIYRSSSLGLLSKTLDVIDVGSYQVTLIPNYESLDNINTSVFQILNNNIKKILYDNYENTEIFFRSSNYKIPFGYILFKIKKGNLNEYHPFGYKHKIISFDYPFEKILFVPTRHEHGNIFNSNIFSRMYFPKDDEIDEWDHKIYAISKNQPIYLNNISNIVPKSNVTKSYKILFDMDKIPNFEFGVLSNDSILRFEINNKNKNGDLCFVI